jgi:eukaryotic-like serine/threonine-protein kinase
LTLPAGKPMLPLGGDACEPGLPPNDDGLGARTVVTEGRLIGGRYKIDALLGGGGMATVWRGRDLRLDRPVAIKQVSGYGLSQPFALERFTREARAVGRLSHPNVVSVYDFGTQDREPYLVMELVEGPTVARLLADGPLPIADVLSIVSQVCDGLAAAHAAGIVHRDIKPANLILTPYGTVKICDFGVARLLDASATPNLTGPVAAMGSPSFMSPEQISGGDIDPRTDLYALGCTMYAMLTGRPPFTAGGPFGIVQQHLSEPPEPLTRRRPDVPAEIEELVADLLAKSPDQRPPYATTVQARVAEALRDPATATNVRSLGSRAPAVPTAATRERPSDRRLWLTAALVAAAVFLTLVAVNVVPALRWAGATTTARWVDRTPGTPAAPAATPSAAATSHAAAPTAQTPASPAATASATPSPPTDPILALRQLIAQEVKTGDLKPDAATDLNHAVDALAKTVATGRTPDILKQITAVRGKLTTYNKEGKLTDSGYAALNAALDRVAPTSA